MQNPLLNPTGQKDTPSPVQTTDFGTVVSARSATAPRRSNAACVMCAKARPQGKLSNGALVVFILLHIFMCLWWEGMKAFILTLLNDTSVNDTFFCPVDPYRLHRACKTINHAKGVLLSISLGHIISVKIQSYLIPVLLMEYRFFLSRVSF